MPQFSSWLNTKQDSPRPGGSILQSLFPINLPLRIIESELYVTSVPLLVQPHHVRDKQDGEKD